MRALSKGSAATCFDLGCAMEGSLATMTGSIPAATNSCFHPSQSYDEMSHLLMCASHELEAARAAATAQGQLHEASVRYLKGLLKTAMRERDEAREQYLQLQERLSRSPSLNGSLVESLPNTGGVGESAADAQQQQLEELQQHLDLDDSHHSGHVPLVHHDQHLDHLEGSAQVLHHLDLACPDAHSSLHPLPTLHSPDEQRSLRRLDDLQQSSSPSDRQQSQQQHQEEHSMQHHRLHHHHHQLLQQRTDEQLEHESEQLLSQMQQQNEQQLQSEQQALVHQQVMHESHSSIAAAMSALQHSSWPTLPAPGLCSPPLSNSLGLASACLHSGSAVASLLSPLDQYEAVCSGPLQLPSRPLHLPEPPEADLQVMLKSLPEKGKLLQAVMQAGPLLQTLLVAGPLPQWRHPPPALDTLDIPRVSISSSPPCDPQASINSAGLMATCGLEQQGVMHLSPPIPIQDNGLSHLALPLSSIPASTTTGLSSQGVIRVSSMGHLAPDMRLLSPPLKYAKSH